MTGVDKDERVRHSSSFGAAAAAYVELSRIRAFLADRPETTGVFDLPMLTGVLRVRRS